MKTGIVEMISNNKVLVGFEDGTTKAYVNKHKFNIKENDQVDIENDEIINVKPYNEELYQEIKELEKEVFNKNLKK